MRGPGTATIHHLDTLSLLTGSLLPIPYFTKNNPSCLQILGIQTITESGNRVGDGKEELERGVQENFPSCLFF